MTSVRVPNPSGLPTSNVHNADVPASHIPPMHVPTTNAPSSNAHTSDVRAADADAPASANVDPSITTSGGANVQQTNLSSGPHDGPNVDTTAASAQTGTAGGAHATFLPPHIMQFITSPDATVTNAYRNAPEKTAISAVVKELVDLAGKEVHSPGAKSPKSPRSPGRKSSVDENVPSKMDKLLDKLHIRRRSSADRDFAQTEVTVGDHVHYRHDQTDHQQPDSWQSDRMVPLTPAQREEVMRAGNWRGTRPSELFLNVYAQALLALDKDIFKGMVSPALMASTGVVPLTIISVIPDIIHHHAVLITRAESEIFLATNYWEASTNAKVITDAIRELSRRVVEQKRKPVVMKLMYDRGNAKQIVSPHQQVDPKVYTDKGILLPAPDEIPGVLLEVQNYHVPPVGTFHSKYMVVDRKIAILNSNNIQDRVNVEMMVHLEGPIVQSFYDMALISWWNAMHPRLALLQTPPNYPAKGNASQYQFGNAHPIAVAHGDLNQAATRAHTTLAEHHRATELRQHENGPGNAAGAQASGAGVGAAAQRGADAAAPAQSTAAASTVPPVQSDVGAAPVQSSAMGGGAPVHSTGVGGAAAAQPSAVDNVAHAHSSAQGGEPLKSDTYKDRTWDATNQAEGQRVNAGVNTRSLNQHLNTGTPVAATDMSSSQTAPFQPILLLPPHDPVPMAMVNRPPKGRPGHGDTIVPQDQAWLAGFKFAMKNVFIQTPTFNAKPVIAATLDAVRRGIQVTIYADLGFNDQGELLPFQGGTNEMIAAQMYAALEEHERDLLRIYWYTGKDQATPLNAKKKSRNCHVKLMIVDGQIAIQGNGNQDSQSWYHSQEINILIDSPLVCEQWRKAIDANQNTALQGRVGQDGVWRDPAGNLLPGAKPPSSHLTRPFAALEGVGNAVQRVRGKGGFAT